MKQYTFHIIAFIIIIILIIYLQIVPKKNKCLLITKANTNLTFSKCIPNKNNLVEGSIIIYKIYKKDQDRIGTIKDKEIVQNKTIYIVSPQIRPEESYQINPENILGISQ